LLSVPAATNLLNKELPTLARAMTRTMSATIARFRHLSIRPNARLRVHAPKIPIVRGWHGWIGFHIQVNPLPAQRGTEIWMIRVKTLEIIDNHVCPPLAA